MISNNIHLRHVLFDTFNQTFIVPFCCFIKINQLSFKLKEGRSVDNIRIKIGIKWLFNHLMKLFAESFQVSLPPLKLFLFSFIVSCHSFYTVITVCICPFKHLSAANNFFAGSFQKLQLSYRIAFIFL